MARRPLIRSYPTLETRIIEDVRVLLLHLGALWDNKWVLDHQHTTAYRSGNGKRATAIADLVPVRVPNQEEDKEEVDEDGDKEKVDAGADATFANEIKHQARFTAAMRRAVDALGETDASIVFSVRHQAVHKSDTSP